MPVNILLGQYLALDILEALGMPSANVVGVRLACEVDEPAVLTVDTAILAEKRAALVEKIAQHRGALDVPADSPQEQGPLSTCPHCARHGRTSDMQKLAVQVSRLALLVNRLERDGRAGAPLVTS